jgi:hypothetical protein
MLMKYGTKYFSNKLGYILYLSFLLKIIIENVFQRTVLIRQCYETFLLSLTQELYKL